MQPPSVWSHLPPFSHVRPLFVFLSEHVRHCLPLHTSKLSGQSVALAHLHTWKPVGAAGHPVFIVWQMPLSTDASPISQYTHGSGEPVHVEQLATAPPSSG